MLCIGECDCRKAEDRQTGFFARTFKRCLSTGRQKHQETNLLKTCGYPKPVTVVLRGRQVHSVKMSGQCRISCTEGIAWVTCSGRSDDYILKAGKSLLLEGEGCIIISGGSGSALVRYCNG